MTYRDRREARAEKLREWAGKRESTATATINEIHDRYSGDHAFNFQPGHIPERARVIARQDRAFESLDKARDMDRRASGIEAQLDASIYDDDPDAIEQLEARVAALEVERDKIKAYNASCRQAVKAGVEMGDVALLEGTQYHARIADIARVGSLREGGALPAYVLSNLSANIKRNRDRIPVIRRQQARRAAAEAAEGGVVIAERNGWCTVTFAEKPARDVINALKAAGFRWSKGSWCGYRDRLPEGIADA
jgi:hypothetical protein